MSACPQPSESGPASEEIITGKTLAQALAGLKDNAVNTIILTEDESLGAISFDPNDSNSPVYNKTDAAIVLKGSQAVTLSLTGQGSLFTIRTGGNLTLAQNITLKGVANNTSSLVRVSASGVFVMKDNSKIIDNEAVDQSGGGVRVSGGSFTMQDTASISGNTSSKSGGGVDVGDGAFTMRGNASITNNTAEAGGGVNVGNATLAMQDTASISSNTANSDHGGGVKVGKNATLIMQDTASISGNTSSNAQGGGVWLHGENATLTMRGNASITNNTAEYGGGVYVHQNATLTMQDTASISSNTSSKEGGGVTVWCGAFTMRDDASITNNTAAEDGGGVRVDENATFTIQDTASISGNTSSKSGGGVSVWRGTFTKKGGIIYGDTDAIHTPDSAENTAAAGSGYAVWLRGGQGKKRNSGAGTGVNLYAGYNADTDSWSYNDSSPGGAGDTTGNWE
ncbi:MAG: hypothetical protein LBP80_09930 [Treponema sp.]|nr:hypothetical protein [Treponema sp.]